MSDDPIAEGRAKAEAFNGEAGDGFKNAGKLNAYQCEACSSYAVTIDREPGVTPFLTRCGNCGGEAKSAFYRVNPFCVPTHEWVRPDSAEGLAPHTVEHLRNGGLILRAIDPLAPRWTLPRRRWA